jgi:hypothetical protein
VAAELRAKGRAVVSRHVTAPPAAVWAVLADGWMYANWVVGASRVRDVDLSWPEPGSRLMHSFGLWPAVISDESLVLEAEPDRWLVVQAKGWPMGEARIELSIEDAGAPQGDSCVVSIVEDAVTGPGVLVPPQVRQPIIAVRNKEAMRRLALIAQGRHREAIHRPTSG